MPLVPLVAVESELQLDRKTTENKAKAMLAARNYDGLDTMAVDLRRSKATHVDGTWKLWDAYKGVTFVADTAIKPSFTCTFFHLE